MNTTQLANFSELANRVKSKTRKGTAPKFDQRFLGLTSPVPVTTKSLDLNRHSQVRAAVEAAGSWKNRLKTTPEASLVLKSKTKGVGKTHIAESIWWSVFFTAPDGYGGQYKQPSCPMFNAVNFFPKVYALLENGESLDKTIRPRERMSQGKVILDTNHHPFIIIDDLGQEQKPQYVAKELWNEVRTSTWFSVFNHCYRKKIGMVVTTNLTDKPDSMTGHTIFSWIGEAAYDRLLEMAPMGYMIDMSSVGSYRIEKSGRLKS